MPLGEMFSPHPVVSSQKNAAGSGEPSAIPPHQQLVCSLFSVPPAVPRAEKPQRRLDLSKFFIFRLETPWHGDTNRPSFRSARETHSGHRSACTTMARRPRSREANPLWYNSIPHALKAMSELFQDKMGFARDSQMRSSSSTNNRHLQGWAYMVICRNEITD